MVKNATRCFISRYWVTWYSKEAMRGAVMGEIVERFFGLLDWCFHVCTAQVVPLAADPLN